MDRRVAAAVECGSVVLLTSVIGQRLARNLPASDTATVRECGDEERVHATLVLQDVEDRFYAFVHKRYGADLDADHLFRIGGRSGQSRSSDSRDRRGGFQEFSSVGIRQTSVPSRFLFESNDCRSASADLQCFAAQQIFPSLAGIISQET